jgi:hypothetical protein
MHSRGDLLVVNCAQEPSLISIQWRLFYFEIIIGALALMRNRIGPRLVVIIGPQCSKLQKELIAARDRQAPAGKARAPAAPAQPVKP